MVALCQDESVIGSEFYVMQRVDGIIPRRDFPPGVSLDEEQARELCTNALDVLIDLHRIDVDATPLAVDEQGRRGTSSGRSPAGRGGSATRTPRTSATTRP